MFGFLKKGLSKMKRVKYLRIFDLCFENLESVKKNVVEFWYERKVIIFKEVFCCEENDLVFFISIEEK